MESELLPQRASSPSESEKAVAGQAESPNGDGEQPPTNAGSATPPPPEGQVPVSFTASMEELEPFLDKLLEQPLTSLWEASALGNATLVRRLLEEPTVKSVIDSPKDPALYVAPLYVAAQNQHSEVVAELIRCGADVNVRRDTKATPLFIATQRNNLGIVQQLLDAGATVDCENDQKCTPFVLACNMGHTDVALELHRRGANREHKETGKTGLAWARSESRAETLRALQVIFTEGLWRKFTFERWEAGARWKIENRRRKEAAEAAEREERERLLNGGPLPSFGELTALPPSGLYPFDLLAIDGPSAARSVTRAKRSGSLDTDMLPPRQSPPTRSRRSTLMSPPRMMSHFSTSTEPQQEDVSELVEEVSASRRRHRHDDSDRPAPAQHVTPDKTRGMTYGAQLAGLMATEFNETVTPPKPAASPQPKRTPLRGSEALHAAADVMRVAEPSMRYDLTQKYISHSGYGQCAIGIAKPPGNTPMKNQPANAKQVHERTMMQRKGPKFPKTTLYN